MVNRIAVFETNLGNFSVELFEDETPITTENFIDLAEKGFYDGVIFHRVIDGFMIQGGDPEGTGMGGPGYTIEDEFRDDLRFDGEGILAMANTGMPHTGGSQFFITLDKTPWLNGHHTIFGKVKEGMDVVRRMLPEAAAHLNDGGMIIVEVGDGAEAVEATFPGLEIIWLATSGGDDQVFLVTKEALLNYFEQ